MPEPAILRDRAGNYRRVTVEHEALNVAELVKIQEKLKNQIPNFRPKGDEDLHLTLFHFGKPHELYRELKAKNPSLKNRDFWHHFRQLLADSRDLVNRKFELTADSLAVFGNPNNPVLALEFDLPKWLAEKLAEAQDSWQKFLAGCGVETFKTVKPFRPHVSLGRLNKKTEPPSINPLVVRFSASRLRNIRNN